MAIGDFSPWGALASGVFGGVASLLSGNKAAELQKQTSLEQARRAALGNQLRLGEATAAAGASGVEMGTGSMQQYLSTMAAEFRRQNEWAVKQAQEGADLSQLANGLGAATNIGKSLFSFGEANNWWAAKPSVT